LCVYGGWFRGSTLATPIVDANGTSTFDVRRCAEGMMNRLQLRHILCPMDLSVISMNALMWANAMARSRAAELRAFHVDVTEGLVATEGLGFHERDDMMQKLRDALFTTDSGNRHTGAAVRRGDPGTQILQFARSLPADVIVMGAAGAERPTRPVGSVTATVVARSECPVLIVPTGRQIDRSRNGVFHTLLCAVDLDPASGNVISQALSLGWETQGEGRLLCVCVMMEQNPSASEIEDRLLAAIPPEAHAWCAIEVVVKRGVPAAEIAKVAEASHVDLLVIGPPRQWTSTTQAVLTKSLCPVLVTHDSRPLPYPGTARAPVAAPGNSDA
jgi:nucleotide-binding universal stress UspA family protein